MKIISGFFIFLFGLIIGSFLNYVIYRLTLPQYSFFKNFIGPKSRSYCPSCEHILRWSDLFPVLSFVFLKGRCRYCHKKISIQYPLVEILTGLIFLIIFNHSTGRFALVLGQNAQKFEHFSFSILNLLFLFYIASVFIIIFVYDLQHYLIPDKVLWPAIIVTFVYRFLDFDHLNLFKISSDFSYYLLAAFLASGFFLSLFLFSKGRWIGFGDCKLAILLGLLLGWPKILLALFLASFFGAIIGIGMIFLYKKSLTPLGVRKTWGKSLKNKLLTGLKSQIPFGPFLITGTFITFFWGDEIIRWYLEKFLIFNF